MKKIISISMLLVVGAFANEGVAHQVAMGDTDFIPRTINFVIFVGILWYLLADKVKTFYANRSSSISKSFEEVEMKLRESQAQKEALKKSVEDANRRADEIIKTAKKEVELIKAKALESAKMEIKALNKQFIEEKEYAENKMKQETVETYLKTLTKDIHLSSEEVANIVTKKVG